MCIFREKTFADMSIEEKKAMVDRRISESLREENSLINRGLNAFISFLKSSQPQKNTIDFIIQEDSERASNRNNFSPRL